jgi:alkylation response protein AidB-like acyl-CoA dehydrogenase
MKLAVSPEQQELRESVRRFLADRAPLPRVRELMETQTGLDLDVWRHAGGQLGLMGIAIGEEYGGSGFSFAEQALVCEELGAALFTGPYLASAVFAANALLACSDEGAKRDLLPPVASGETIAALAFTEDDGSWEPDAIRLSATKNGDGWSLDGHKSFILDGYTAGLLLVVARTDDGLCLFAVDAGPGGEAGQAERAEPGVAGAPGLAGAPRLAGVPGLTRTALPTLDQTRKLARCEFASVPARLIGAPGDGTAILNRVLDVGAIALAAEQLGGAQRALDTVVAYAKVRHQFGRPIGSFQAIKHRCADLLLEVESLRSAVAYAAAAVAEDSPEVPVLASLVKALGSDVYFHVAAESIQMHGGIGFTWEHDAHLYFKRAKSSELFLGDPSYHRERLATRLGI